MRAAFFQIRGEIIPLFDVAAPEPPFSTAKTRGDLTSFRPRRPHRERGEYACDARERPSEALRVVDGTRIGEGAGKRHADAIPPHVAPSEPPPRHVLLNRFS